MVDQAALRHAQEAGEDFYERNMARLHHNRPDDRAEMIEAAIEAYEAVRPDPNPWRSIDDVPVTPNAPVYPSYVELFNGFHVGIGYAQISQDGEDTLEFWSETAEPIEPKPIMFRTIVPPQLQPPKDAS